MTSKAWLALNICVCMVWGMWGPHIVTAHCLCIYTCLCVRKSIHIVLFTAYIQVLVYNLVSFSSNMPLKRWVQTLLSFECSWKSTLMQQFIVSPSIPGSLTEIKSPFCRLKLFSSEFSHPARSLHCHRWGMKSPLCVTLSLLPRFSTDSLCSPRGILPSV